MTLGEKIKQQRKNAGLSQEKVAELMGVSRQAVTKWETDQSAPSTKNLLKLADILETSVSSLLESSDTDRHADAFQMYNKLVNEESQTEQIRKNARKWNAVWAIAIASGHLLLFVFYWLTIGINHQMSVTGWIVYHFPLLIAAMVSMIACLFGKVRLSMTAFAVSFIGLVAGTIASNSTGDIQNGINVVGWGIWFLIFFTAITASTVWEWLSDQKNAKGRLIDNQTHGPTAGTVGFVENEIDQAVVAEQIVALYKLDEIKRKAVLKAAAKKNLRLAALIAAGYAGIYALGYWITNILAYRNYLFGWLADNHLLFFAAIISILSAVFGRRYFAAITLSAAFAGIILGELFGRNPAGAPYGHGHYGWAIWIGIFLLSIPGGIIVEKASKSTLPSLHPGKRSRPGPPAP